MEPEMGVEPTMCYHDRLQICCLTVWRLWHISFTLLFHLKPYQLFFLPFGRIHACLLSYVVAS